MSNRLPLEVNEDHFKSFKAILEPGLRPHSNHFATAMQLVSGFTKLLKQPKNPKARERLIQNAENLINRDIGINVNEETGNFPSDKAKKFREKLEVFFNQAEVSIPEFVDEDYSTLQELLGLMQRSYTVTGRKMGLTPDKAKAPDIQLKSPKNEQGGTPPEPKSTDHPTRPIIPNSRVRINWE